MKFAVLLSILALALHAQSDSGHATIQGRVSGYGWYFRPAMKFSRGRPISDLEEGHNLAMNCWEFKNCGRQPGGSRVGELGVCPASTNSQINGTNAGRNGGRICWALAGTFCGGKIQGTFAQKLPNCVTCDFYKLVRAEQGQNLRSFADVAH